MRAYVVPGVFLAAATGLLVWGGELLGLDLQHLALLGAAIGGAAGLVPDRSPALRAGGLLVGAVAGWLGYALRAATLPDSSGGRAVAAMTVVVICVFAVFLAAGRLPLWAMLLGVAASVGAYEDPYTAAPAQFLATSPTALTTVLLAAALGFLATVALSGHIDDDPGRERGRRRERDGDGAATDERATDRADAAAADGTFWDEALR